MNGHGSRCPCVECRRHRNTAARARYRQQYPDAERRGAQDRTPAHGTRARYVKHKCRCEPCTTANSEYARARYAQQRTLHRNLARGDDLTILDQSLTSRGKALEAAGETDRLDEVIRLRTQIALVRRARDRVGKAA